jgi:hypothetical protein
MSSDAAGAILSQVMRSDRRRTTRAEERERQRVIRQDYGVAVALRETTRVADSLASPFGAVSGRRKALRGIAARLPSVVDREEMAELRHRS